MTRRIPEVEKENIWEAFSASNERFSEHFCWPMELVLALGISSFILINPLNFRALPISNTLNVLCVHYGGQAAHCSGRALGNKNRTGLKRELFHRETQIKCSATLSIIPLTNGKVSKCIISKQIYYEFQSTIRQLGKYFPIPRICSRLLNHKNLS